MRETVGIFGMAIVPGERPWWVQQSGLRGGSLLTRCKSESFAMYDVLLMLVYVVDRVLY